MSGLSAALWCEALKARGSKVLWISFLFFAFVAVILALLMVVARHPSLAGDSVIVGQKAARLGDGDWSSLLAFLVQTILALGPLGFGIVTSWTFGREDVDHTLKDLLSLPTRRTTIVTAKFLVVAIWSAALALVLFFLALAVGWALGTPGWSPSVLRHALIEFAVGSFLTILLCSPVAFVASASKGYLLPIGLVLLVLILTQLLGMGMPAAMPYFPWAIPAVCSGAAAAALPPANIVSYLMLGLTCLIGFFATVWWWRYADHA